MKQNIAKRIFAFLLAIGLPLKFFTACGVKNVESGEEISTITTSQSTSETVTSLAEEDAAKLWGILKQNDFNMSYKDFVNILKILYGEEIKHPGDLDLSDLEFKTVDMLTELFYKKGEKCIGETKLGEAINSEEIQNINVAIANFEDGCGNSESFYNYLVGLYGDRKNNGLIPLIAFSIAHNKSSVTNLGTKNDEAIDCCLNVLLDGRTDEYTSFQYQLVKTSEPQGKPVEVKREDVSPDEKELHGKTLKNYTIQGGGKKVGGGASSTEKSSGEGGSSDKDGISGKEPTTRIETKEFTAKIPEEGTSESVIEEGGKVIEEIIYSDGDSKKIEEGSALTLTRPNPNN